MLFTFTSRVVPGTSGVVQLRIMHAASDLLCHTQKDLLLGLLALLKEHADLVYGLIHLPVSYTHLTLPTIYSV